jgi:fructokinase
MDSGRRVLVAGETLVDFLPATPGPLAIVESFTRRPGGAPANVAVGLARLGETPWFWTRVGEDPFGQLLVETLEREGLPDRFVEYDSDAHTSLAFVAHDTDADRGFTFYRDGTADTRMEVGSVPDGALESVEWVVAGGVTLADGPSREATLDLLERAAAADATVAFDPNARPELWVHDDFEETVGRALEHVDVLRATAEELRALGFEGTDGEALSRAVLDSGGGPHTVLTTLGDAGARAVASGDAPWGPVTATHPGYPVEPVDTTGAGDAFLAGAVASLVGGETDLSRVLSFANAVAAVTTTGAGAMTTLPTREAVSEFRGGRAARGERG